MYVIVIGKHSDEIDSTRTVNANIYGKIGIDRRGDVQVVEVIEIVTVFIVSLIRAMS